MPIPLPDTGTATSDEPALTIEQLGTGAAILATHTETPGVAIIGRAAGDASIGVAGASETGVGLAGFGGPTGVMGIAEVVGVGGGSMAGTGVRGRTTSGVGVGAIAFSGVGVFAESTDGIGVYARSETDNGVVAEAAEPGRAAVFASHSGPESGFGVVGLASQKGSIGIFGEGEIGMVAQGREAGVHALASDGPGVSARSEETVGVLGVTESLYDAGVEGRAESNAGPSSTGVLGFAITGVGVRARSAAGVALDAESSSTHTAQLRGSAGNVLWIEAQPGAGRGIKVNAPECLGVGINSGDDQIALQIRGGRTVLSSSDLLINDGDVTLSGDFRQAYGDLIVSYGKIAVRNEFSPGNAAITGVSLQDNYSFGVRGEAVSRPTSEMPMDFAAGIYGRAIDQTRGTQWAGWFDGNVHVRGTLCKTSLCFQIDHPLRPKEQYLLHSTLESDERRNFYDGIVTLDASGSATVELPEWFDALNISPRYQLTAMGCAAPNLHIAEELRDGRFRIGGGAAGQRVSWQITAIRNDAWARANPFVVEEDKVAPAKGRYLHPEVHGAPPEEGMSLDILAPAETPKRPVRPAPPIDDDKPEEPVKERRTKRPRLQRIRFDAPARPKRPRDVPDPKLR